MKLPETLNENPFYDLVSQVFTLEEQSETTERDELVEALWKQIKKRIDEGGEDEARLAMSFLSIVLMRTIRYTIEPEDFHIVINNINKYLTSHLSKNRN